MATPFYHKRPLREENSLSHKLLGTGTGAGIGAVVTLLGATIAGKWAVAEKYGIYGDVKDIDAFMDFAMGNGPAILGVCTGVGIIADLYLAWDRYKKQS